MDFQKLLLGGNAMGNLGANHSESGAKLIETSLEEGLYTFLTMQIFMVVILQKNCSEMFFLK